MTREFMVREFEEDPFVKLRSTLRTVMCSLRDIGSDYLPTLQVSVSHQAGACPEAKEYANAYSKRTCQSWILLFIKPRL